MKFFEKHFNKHHLFHAPHKWFFAFLSSPIHFLEKRYQKVYHLKFVHARKLFIFDILLLLSAVGIFAITIFWWNYDPTVTSLVSLEVTPAYSAERLTSGQYVSYGAKFKNNSDTILKNPELSLTLPPGFIYQDSKPEELFDKEKMKFVLSDINPGQQGVVNFGGVLFGAPGESQNINTTLSYTQVDRDVSESVYHRAITVFRDSYLQAELIMPTDILVGVPTEVAVILKNTSPDSGIDNIFLPLENNWSNYEVSVGEIKNKIWHIDKIESGKSVELTGSLTLADYSESNNYEISVTPNVQVGGLNIPQVSSAHVFKVSRPQMNISSSWEKNIEKLLPGEEAKIFIDIENTGNTSLENLEIKTLIPANLTNSNRLTTVNIGRFSQGNFVIDSNHHAGLQIIEPGESTTVELSWPISWSPYGGEDVSLILNHIVEGSVPNVPAPNNIYSRTTKSSPIKIGTSLNLNSEVRYYTQEGDQLGRGPLPPQVGKETKYWILTTVKNGTSKVKDLQFQAKLPDYVYWTDKSSVSHGSDVKYSANNHTVSWFATSLPANTPAGIYFQLGITPTVGQVGTSPILVNNMTLSAFDSYIEANLSKNLGSLDISIPNDQIGKVKGTQIIPPL